MLERNGTYRAGKPRAMQWIAASVMMSCWSAPGFSACLPSVGQANKEEIGYFKINPGQTLIRAQRDRDKLSQLVAQYIGTDISVLEAVKALAETVPSRYKMSVGVGLGLAQQECTGKDPLWARRIQAFVNGLQDMDLVSGYRTSVQGDPDPPVSLDNSVPAPTAPQAADDLRLIDPFKPLPIPGP